MTRSAFTAIGLVVVGSVVGIATGAVDSSQDDKQESRNDVTFYVGHLDEDVSETIYYLRDGVLHSRNVASNDVPLAFSVFPDLMNSAEAEAQTGTVLGVYANPADAALRSHLRVHGEFGLIVTHIQSDSAAEQAGLQEFDVLMEFDGQQLVNRDQFRTLVRSRQPGEEVSLRLYREGKAISVPVVLQSGEINDQTPQPLTEEEIDNLNPRTHFRDFRFRQCSACHDSSNDTGSDNSPEYSDI